MSSQVLALRPYQRECIDAIQAAWADGMQRPAVVLATGMGKTVVFSRMAAEHVAAEGTRVVILVHRDELADQTLNKLKQTEPGLFTGKVKASADNVAADVMVCSVQTLAREKRLHRLLDSQEKCGRVGLVIVDECHHAAAVSYRNILAALGCYSGMPGTRAVGFTATLARGDGQGLGDVWEDAVFTRSPLWAMSRGFLTDVRSKVIDVDTLHLGDVKRSRGDYTASSLGDAMMEAGGPQIIAKVLEEHAADRRSPIVFTPTVEVARATAEALPDAAYVHGGTPRDERLSIYRRFRTGEVRTLVNCMVLTEGFDAPWADCAVIARPTKSEPLFCLDDRTEILTDQGWKGMDDDLAEARPAAYDLTDGSVHWSPLLARVERPLGTDEEMFALSSPTADIRVSDRHRMVWRSRNDATWRVSEARDLASRHSEYRIPIAGVQKAPGVPLTDDEIRFVGWFMTDGTLNRGTRHITILQAEHQPWNADIRACLEGCGFKFSVSRSDHATQYSRTSSTMRYGISYGKPRGTDKHLRGWADLEPYLSKDLAPALEDLTRDQLAVLLHAMHLGDGAKQVNQTWTRRSYHISTGNRVMADRLQSLCVRRGFKCNVAVHTYNARPLYVLHIKDTTVKTVGGCGQDDRQSFGRDKARPGERVWCVETDAGTIVTRRNGKVSIIGNCQMVGRVLRPSPATGKDDALVLILAGEGGSLCTLVDLEPGAQIREVADGETLAEAYERGEAEKDAKVPAGSLRFELKHRDIDLFKASAAYSWLRTHGGVQFIPLGDNGEILLWPNRDEAEKWDVAYAPPRGKWERLHEGLDLGIAMAWAETEATDRSELNMTRTASWRKKPASPKLVGLLRYAGQNVPDGIRAGLASDLFAVTIASRKLDPFMPRDRQV